MDPELPRLQSEAERAEAVRLARGIAPAHRLAVDSTKDAHAGLYALGPLVPILGRDVRIFPRATVVGEVILGDRVSVWFGAVLRGDHGPIVIGNGTNIQDNAILHSAPLHPTRIGNSVSIGHGAIIHGAAIGDGSIIGMGAVILDGASIAGESLIAAGSVIPSNRDFPAGVLIMGSPARVVRDLDRSERDALRENARHYEELNAVYRRELVAIAA